MILQSVKEATKLTETPYTVWFQAPFSRYCKWQYCKRRRDSCNFISTAWKREGDGALEREILTKLHEIWKSGCHGCRKRPCAFFYSILTPFRACLHERWISRRTDVAEYQWMRYVIFDLGVSLFVEIGKQGKGGGGQKCQLWETIPVCGIWSGCLAWYLGIQSGSDSGIFYDELVRDREDPCMRLSLPLKLISRSIHPFIFPYILYSKLVSYTLYLCFIETASPFLWWD